MSFAFATCDRKRALGFLSKLYPSYAIEDSLNCAGPLLDLVEADVVRITDPDFHKGEVIPSNNWDEEKRNDYLKVCQDFHDGLA